MKKIYSLLVMACLITPFWSNAQMVDIQKVVPDSNYCGKSTMGVTVSGYLSYFNTFTFEGDTSWVSGDTLYSIIEYSWYSGLGFPSLQAFSFHFTYPALPQGTYWVNATSIYNNNLSDDSLVSFNMPSGVDASITVSDKYPCIDESVTLENYSSSTSKYWIRNGAIVDSSNSYTFSHNKSENLDVMLKVIDGACYDSTFESLVIQDFPEIDLGNDTTLCDGDTLFMNMYDPKYRTYEWDNGSTFWEREITQSGMYSLRVMNNHCYASDSITVDFEDCTVGIKNQRKGEFDVYYSPEGILRIKTNSETQIRQTRILDLQGRIESEWNINNNAAITELNVSNLSSGMHVLMIYTDHEIQSFRFVKY